MKFHIALRKLGRTPLKFVAEARREIDYESSDPQEDLPDDAYEEGAIKEFLAQLKALELKPDYVEAQELLDQVQSKQLE